MSHVDFQLLMRFFRINKLKAEFTKIHTFLLYINACEKGTGEHLRNTTQELTIQKLEQDRAISQQFTGNAEIGEMKRELLRVCIFVFTGNIIQI